MTESLISAIEAIINENLGFGPPIPGFNVHATATQIAAIIPTPVAQEAKKTALTLKLDIADLEKVVGEFAQTVADFKEAMASLPTEDDGE